MLDSRFGELDLVEIDDDLADGQGTSPKPTASGATRPSILRLQTECGTRIWSSSLAMAGFSMRRQRKEWRSRRSAEVTGRTANLLVSDPFR